MKILRQVLLLMVMLAIGAGAAYAYFSAQAKVQGASFSTGTAFLKLSKVYPGGDSDWVSSMPGENFQGLIPGWTRNYDLYVKNTGTTHLTLKFYGELKGTDIDNLRDLIHLKLTDKDTSTQIFDKTLTQLSTPFDLGQINSNMPRKFNLAFEMQSTATESADIKTIDSYNFVFDGTAEPTIQPTP